ncbi:cell wall protein Gas5 [Schizosaccharomyces cryophilus OY26]|uniref:1,3-beta-glucanosyltransferase n=1 Tax=Schizosaccharomyces cryophilus (strain OY26 / ATCC MYA-4695 / CBS 11777 / NBRC 106824 / NRRL Y48691) TaxID=653667 RepID=S9VVM0_SCHCR|nr:cell wall protein Gas5 [Schizosaccharomyces cryophilus OY26]EPY50165.1 cell wall protein Gas5 [Schizosaccharomyces cryophilus OY26]
MNFLQFLAHSFALLSIGRIVSASTPHIEVRGNAFFNSESNERFYLRGVDYQPGGSSSTTDPLAVTENCKRDIPYLKDLNVNTIRVYQVDNTANHDECMKELEDAGIYVLLDLATSKNSISRLDAASSYNAIYLQGIFASIDAFKDYNNVLGFFAGNEVANEPKNAATTTWVKAALRDAKKYIKNNSKRQIPVGYSAADVAEIRVQCADFFACGDDDEARADFYGMNMYEWCGSGSSFSLSGYDQRMKDFANYSIPLFLSEYGCNTVSIESDGTPDRPFNEVDALFSDKMASVFSGGLVYEYTEEGSNYGLVTLNGNSVKTSKNYEALKEKYSKAAKFAGDGGYNKNPKPLSCPPNDENWSSFPLPDTPSQAEQFIQHGAGQPLGLNAPSNQEGSTNATALVSAGPHSSSTSVDVKAIPHTQAIQSTTSSSGSASSTGSNVISSGSVSGSGAAMSANGSTSGFNTSTVSGPAKSGSHSGSESSSAPSRQMAGVSIAALLIGAMTFVIL